ncbi:GTPase activating protein [Apophysomyces sp. BC1034]|nr:GTPase activating protein [Apophysomyces sp. BC1021]KAG0184437.1 GTPase activating protein [Apophysomyces sp. BC1034]
MGGGPTNSPPVQITVVYPQVPTPPNAIPVLHYQQPQSSQCSSITPVAPPPLPPIPLAYTPNRTRPDATPPETTLHKLRLIYAKSGFYLRSQLPGGPAIHGFLAIVSNHMVDVNIVIAWIPEYLIEPEDLERFIQLDGMLASDQGFPSIKINMGENETTLIELLNTHSLYVCPPTSDEQGSIIITTRAGDILKPLWYDPSEHMSAWPGHNILDILGAFAQLDRVSGEPHVYRVLRPGESAEEERPSPPQSSISDASTDPLTQALRDARWSILERFSKVTKLSRDTAVQLLDHPIARPIIPLLPPSVQAMSRNGTVRETMNDYNVATHYLTRWAADGSSKDNNSNNWWRIEDPEGLISGMSELNQASAQPVPTHTRRAPVAPEEWIDLFNDEGRLRVTEAYVNKLIFRAGLDPDVRIEAWKFLLGIYPWDSTFDEREAIRRSKAEEYYEIKAMWFNHMEVRDTKEFKDEKHRIDKDVHRTDRSIDFFAGEDLPNPDPDMSVGTNANLEIMKDILVTYNFHNTELGYVQGMSDLLAPLFVAMGDEAMAFWGFVRFMDRVQSNFFTDQSGMHSQLKTLDALIQFMDPPLYKHFEKTETTNLFFCFRWLLVWFKREFAWEDVIRLWEVLWTDHLCSQMLMFIALAVLDQHRQVILDELHQFDELLKYINDLSGAIPLNETLERAEVLFCQFERRVQAMDRKKTELEEHIQKRSVWNHHEERSKVQDAIQNLTLDEKLRGLLSTSPKWTNFTSGE